ncbi:MAG: 2-oxoisovalerate dehydrogenase component, partial [Actinomycetota bacterium]|nr:2-oxoisovalerate dehydrogenase component [Actinomycetota bacterium]
YHTRDLYAPGDGGWLTVDRGVHAPLGSARLQRQTDHPDLTVVTFGNGVPMSLRVAGRLADQGVGVDVLDLRWLAPLPVRDLLESARQTGRVLVVDETRHSGGVGAGVLAALVEGGFDGPMARVCSQDSFIPLGAAAQHVLLNSDDIEKAAMTLAGKGRR